MVEETCRCHSHKTYSQKRLWQARLCQGDLKREVHYNIIKYICQVQDVSAVSFNSTGPAPCSDKNQRPIKEILQYCSECSCHLRLKGRGLTRIELSTLVRGALSTFYCKIHWFYSLKSTIIIGRD